MGSRRSAGQPARLGRGDAAVPRRANGPALLTFRNFQVIKRYNNADSYAIAIAHLADRLRGGGPSSPPGRATTAR
jgi:membrane-bound lytic murein transglycosylase B